MSRDFLADLLYHLYSADEKEHPQSPEAQERLAKKIDEILNTWQTPNQTQNEGEEHHG